MDISGSGKYIFLGGTRSGKSYLAEQAIATGKSRLCYLATAPTSWVEHDADFAIRVREHRLRRTERWQVIELVRPEDLYDLVLEAKLPTLIDSVGTWLASSRDFQPDLERLAFSIKSSMASLIFVAEETGLGIHAMNESSRRYIDTLGTVNRIISEVVDRTFFVAAGKAVELVKPSFYGPFDDC